MKTTVEIPDTLLDAARKVAAREGTTVKALIERSLRELLVKRKSEHEFRLRKASYKGKGLKPGVQQLGLEKLRELAYEGRGA